MAGRKVVGLEQMTAEDFPSSKTKAASMQELQLELHSLVEAVVP